MLQSDYLKKEKEIVQTSRKTIYDLIGGTKINTTYKVMKR